MGSGPDHSVCQQARQWWVLLEAGLSFADVTRAGRRTRGNPGANLAVRRSRYLRRLRGQATGSFGLPTRTLLENLMTDSRSSKLLRWSDIHLRIQLQIGLSGFWRYRTLTRSLSTRLREASAYSLKAKERAGSEEVI